MFSVELNYSAGSARCARCGRILTDPRSIADGIGPICKRKIQAAIRREQECHHSLVEFVTEEKVKVQI